MNVTIKQFIVRRLLGLLRILIFTKRHGGAFLKTLATPLRSLGLFFVRYLGIPVYRLFFFFQRHLRRALLPAKYRILLLVSNRFSTHVVMGLLVAGVVFVNLSARDVRAETFGQRSLLYQLVAEDDFAALEVVEAGESIVTLGARSSYLSDTVVDARRHIDLDYLEETYVSPLVGEVLLEEEREAPVRTGIETHMVQEGDTLGKIAEAYGLSLSTILWSNDLSYTSTIHPGDELKILPVDGVLYTVRSGDTLSRIARAYSVSIDTIMSQNQLASADTLAIGDQLLLIGGEPPSPVGTTRSSASLIDLFSKVAPGVATGGWIWPTDWYTITQYYTWRHTGIDIDGDYSTYSYASRGGVVIYSGWRSGYGLSVEIDHGDGYVTRYAHHSKNYVSVGDVVDAGQVVAQTGTTGRSTGTHLHFEVIRNGRFQNPLDYVR